MANTYDTTAFPLGSKDPRVLYNNAENEDLFVNDIVNEYFVDRPPFRRNRLTLFGMTQAFYRVLANIGFETAYLTYAAGVVIQRPTQLVVRNGIYYSVANPTNVPLALTGDWATDAPKLRDVGDATLRAQLLSTSGTSYVYRGAQTLESSLVAIESSVTALKTDTSKLPFSTGSQDTLIDMHFGALKGTGFISAEPGGVQLFTATAATSSRFLQISSTATFFIGQLICYLAANGEYYSGIIQSKDATTLTLQYPVESPVAIGGEVCNFYSDVSHPNERGFRTIVDYMLRQMLNKQETVVSWRAGDDYTTTGTATVGSLAVDEYYNPGSSTLPSVDVTATTVNAAFYTPKYDLPAGKYSASVTLTPTLSSTSPATAGSYVGILETLNGTETTIASLQSYGNNPVTQTVTFKKKKGSTISVRVMGEVASHRFAIASMQVKRLIGNIKSLNSGTWVLFGDSWFVNVGFAARLAARLPRANIVSKGVGGNTSAQLVNRFAADVVPSNPDKILIMCGTNDNAQGVTLETFNTNIGILSALSAGTKADCIFFNASVGPLVHPTLGNLLRPSRQFALFGNYIEDAPDAKANGSVPRSTFSINFELSIPASSTKRVLLLPGTTTRGVFFKSIYAIGQTGAVTGNIKIGFGTGAGASPTDDVQTFAMAATVRGNTTIAKTLQTDRFCIMEIQNTSASVFDVIGYVNGDWLPS